MVEFKLFSMELWLYELKLRLWVEFVLRKWEFDIYGIEFVLIEFTGVVLEGIYVIVVKI
jgi:hypothetical protein